MTRFAALAAAWLVAGCAIQPPHPGAFAFAVLGDQPYTEGEEIAFDAFVDAMNADRLAFVVHVGDLKGSREPCTDALFADRHARFGRSRHPFAYTPGDNDWVDCRRHAAGFRDPLERLAKLRAIFFSHSRFLGPATAPAQDVMPDCAWQEGRVCRCPGLPENRRWSQPVAGTSRAVVFATLNVQGSNDNVGFDAASDREAACRGIANRRWLEATFENAKDNALAIVVIFHANPFVEGRQRVHAALREALVREAQRFGRPVLVIHGDTHWHRVDRPFRDAEGRAVANLMRLEVFGSPLLGWVRVTADPADARFFHFETRGQRESGSE